MYAASLVLLLLWACEGGDWYGEKHAFGRERLVVNGCLRLDFIDL